MTPSGNDERAPSGNDERVLELNRGEGGQS